MKDFAILINHLESTNKASLRENAIIQFFKVASEKDKLWFIALFTGKKPKRKINTKLLKQWVIEIRNIPEWLFVESYSAVGDLAETLSLLLPQVDSSIDLNLAAWMDKINALDELDDEEKKNFVISSWFKLNTIERFIFNKLILGNFRIGISSKTLTNTIAKLYNLDSNTITHSLMGEWTVKNTNFEDLINGKYINANLSKPYPFCLAYPLDKEIFHLGESSNWQVEWKWDGIRGQFIKRNNEIYIWSRGEEIINVQFPELVELLKSIPGNFVLDGEILAFKEGEILNFEQLQKRLNRKKVSKKLLLEVPVALKLYDLLEWDNRDYRPIPLVQRRIKLEEIYNSFKEIKWLLSEKLNFKNWNDLVDYRKKARGVKAEGLMLKNLMSPYHSGRKKGDWWKWKIDPLSIDVVLLYAQKGSGRRSGFYSDYTFGVKKGDKLVTIAKAYSGLTDKEIQEVSRFISKNTIEKFGPVRTVKPELVFEIGFEGIGFSNRHKSGVALRFPRILRWRKDKTVDEIDDIEQVLKLIT